MALASADLDGRRVFAQWGRVMKLGIWSYCFYLVHLMVLQRTHGVGERFNLPEVVTVITAVPVAVAAAWLLHVTIERRERFLRPGAGVDSTRTHDGNGMQAVTN